MLSILTCVTCCRSVFKKLRTFVCGEYGIEQSIRIPLCVTCAHHTIQILLDKSANSRRFDRNQIHHA